MAERRDIDDLERAERMERIEQIVSSQVLTVEDIIRHSDCPPWLSEEEWRQELLAKGYASS